MPITDEHPPVGQVWFAESFDADTFEIRDRITSVGTNDAFSMVAHFGEPIDSEDFSLRVYFDDELIFTGPSNSQGSGILWGFSHEPLVVPGTWRFELIDVGGNVLASGEIEATE